MSLYKNKYRIESARLQNWDYSNPGLYYVTVCVKNRLNILGEIINSKMTLNKNGEILKTWLLKIDNRYENAKMDAWVIMPNHWHCIIDITGNDDKNDGDEMVSGDTINVDPIPVETIHESSLRESDRRDSFLQRMERYPKQHIQNHTPNNPVPPHSKNQPDKNANRDKRRKMLLSKIMGYIKMNSSKYINIELNQSGTGLWQKGYYDRIIRDKDEYYRVVHYIENNPRNWEDDRMNNAAGK